MKALYIIASVLPALVALFWSITLLSGRHKASDPRKWLGIFMLAAFILYSCHALIFTGEHLAYFRVKALYNLAALSVYPLFFLYVLLMSIRKQISLSFLWHFLPALGIAILMLIFSAFMISDEIQRYIQRVVLNDKTVSLHGSFYANALFYTYRSARIIFGIQVICYTYFGFKLLNKYRYLIEGFYSNTGDKNISWIQILILAMIGIGFMAFFFNVIGRGYFTKGNLVFIPSFIFSFLLFVIGLQGNQHVSYVEKLHADFQANDKVIDDEIDIIHETTPIETNSEMELSILEKLTRLMEEEKCFLNSDLKITDITRKIGSNRIYVSHVINSHYQLHFNEFVNYYRVQYAKEMLHSAENDHYSMEYIAEYSGFGSLSTFNRNFKKFENQTPHEFRESNSAMEIRIS